MNNLSGHLADRRHLWVGAVILSLTLAASLWFVRFVLDTGDRQVSERLESLARTVAATLEPENVAALTGTEDDAGSPDFIVVHNELRRARNANPEFRFVYLMRPSVENPDSLIFLVDAESADSPDYSAPGDTYDGPSNELWLAFREGTATVQPPYEDSWGYWITPVAPVLDRNHKVLAILGMDMRAEFWLASRARYRSFALAISGLVLALEALFLLGLHIQKTNARRLAKLNGKLQWQLDELDRAQARLRLADEVVQHTGDGIVVLDSALRTIRVNPGFSRITGYSAESIHEKSLTLFEEEDALAKIDNHLQQNSHWAGTLWARRAAGERFPMEASFDVARDAAGEVDKYVLVFRDVTVQKKLEDRLRELSATDALTLLANRRTFDETLEREWHAATRTGKAMSLLMMDVDHFKKFNDLYGHPAGDACLQKVANALATAVDHEGALVARYGGEEFAVILPNCETDAAFAAGEAIRRRVEAIGLEHAGNETGHVTISIDLSTRTPPQLAEYEDLKQSADEALYKAKKSGRNTVSAG